MGIFYPLADHQFLATPTLDAFYIIRLVVDDQVPQIVRKVRLDGADKKGISFQLGLDEVNRAALLVEEGNIFAENDQVEMLVAGKVLVETSSRFEDHTLVRLNAYFNGGMVDTANRSVTVAGIGITDIIATDPLNVTLVNAPLTTIPVYDAPGAAPVDRRVIGVFLDYGVLPFDSLRGTVAASIVEVKIAVERIAIKRI